MTKPRKCFYPGCDLQAVKPPSQITWELHSRYCAHHARLAQAWLKDERRLDAEDEARRRQAWDRDDSTPEVRWDDPEMIDVGDE